MIRRFLHLYWRFSRGVTLGVRGAAFDPDGKVLLVRHSYVPGWHFPGGGVEPGETMLEALAREMQEEGNVTLTGDPVLHGMFLNDAASRRDHVALFVMRVFTWGGPLPANAEILEAGFFALDRLPDGTTGATRRRLAEIASGGTPAGRW